MTTSPATRISACAALFAALVCAASCGGTPTDEDDGWKPDPVPEPGDIVLSVAAAEPKVPLGDDIVFRVTISNRGRVATKVNRPRISQSSIQFRVRCDAFDAAWISRHPCRESPQGAGPDPETVADLPAGGTVEGEVRTTAVLAGKLVFSPVYTWQGADAPITCAAVPVEVVPADGKSNLGFRLETSHGAMEAKFRPDVAYGTCEAQASLMKKGYFDGLTFHRVIQGFMAQGGDPSAQGWGGPGYTLKLEFPGKLLHRRGVFSMARQTQPDTAGSQFFVMFGNRPDLDRAKYATFAEMTSGDETLLKIESVGAPSGPASGSEAPREKITITKASLLLLP